MEIDWPGFNQLEFEQKESFVVEELGPINQMVSRAVYRSVCTSICVGNKLPAFQFNRGHVVLVMAIGIGQIANSPGRRERDTVSSDPIYWIIHLLEYNQFYTYLESGGVSSSSSYGIEKI